MSLITWHKRPRCLT